MNIEKVLYKRLFGVVPKLNGNIYKGSKRLNKRLKFIQKEVYDKNLKVQIPSQEEEEIISSLSSSNNDDDKKNNNDDDKKNNNDDDKKNNNDDDKKDNQQQQNDPQNENFQSMISQLSKSIQPSEGSKYFSTIPNPNNNLQQQIQDAYNKGRADFEKEVLDQMKTPPKRINQQNRQLLQSSSSQVKPPSSSQNSGEQQQDQYPTFSDYIPPFESFISPKKEQSINLEDNLHHQFQSHQKLKDVNQQLEIKLKDADQQMQQQKFVTDELQNDINKLQQDKKQLEQTVLEYHQFLEKQQSIEKRFNIKINDLVSDNKNIGDKFYQQLQSHQKLKDVNQQLENKLKEAEEQKNKKNYDTNKIKAEIEVLQQSKKALEKDIQEYKIQQNEKDLLIQQLKKVESELSEKLQQKEIMLSQNEWVSKGFEQKIKNYSNKKHQLETQINELKENEIRQKQFYNDLENAKINLENKLHQQVIELNQNKDITKELKDQINDLHIQLKNYKELYDDKQLIEQSQVDRDYVQIQQYNELKKQFDNIYGLYTQILQEKPQIESDVKNKQLQIDQLKANINNLDMLVQQHKNLLLNNKTAYKTLQQKYNNDITTLQNNAANIITQLKQEQKQSTEKDVEYTRKLNYQSNQYVQLLQEMNEKDKQFKQFINETDKEHEQKLSDQQYEMLGKINEIQSQLNIERGNNEELLKRIEKMNEYENKIKILSENMRKESFLKNDALNQLEKLKYEFEMLNFNFMNVYSDLGSREKELEDLKNSHSILENYFVKQMEQEKLQEQQRIQEQLRIQEQQNRFEPPVDPQQVIHEQQQHYNQQIQAAEDQQQDSESQQFYDFSYIDDQEEQKIDQNIPQQQQQNNVLSNYIYRTGGGRQPDLSSFNKYFQYIRSKLYHIYQKTLLPIHQRTSPEKQYEDMQDQWKQRIRNFIIEVNNGTFNRQEVQNSLRRCFSISNPNDYDILSDTGLLQLMQQ